MGSRSKFHKSDEASTPGRALLHVGARRQKDPKFQDPRRRKPEVVNITKAFWDSLRERRANAKSDDPEKRAAAKPAPRDLTKQPRTPRAVRRAEAFMEARTAPRKQRREAFETAREAAVLA